ncbi:cyanate lyase C-terminal domain-containing protein [Rhodotorula diobovata]|uniref:Cyanate hydratase n=1 Tax=Rhodotorula diobovata TaxID=5288 RepID=A0A5C5FR55_9BASI|nr:cyanate lyase C-terminal domain-containing protein [Rhodotorula diobovata]
MTSVVQSLPSVHQSLFEAKAVKGLTFEQIAQRVERDEVWVASLFYGQVRCFSSSPESSDAKPTEVEVKKLGKVLGLQEGPLLKHFHTHWFPERGDLTPMPPRDPTLYRLYEIILVYGYGIKSVIHEKFGDGIMSAINFSCNVKKVEKNGADNVQITLTGKWLPYDFHE